MYHVNKSEVGAGRMWWLAELAFAAQQRGQKVTRIILAHFKGNEPSVLEAFARAGVDNTKVDVVIAKDHIDGVSKAILPGRTGLVLADIGWEIFQDWESKLSEEEQIHWYFSLMAAQSNGRVSIVFT